MADIKFSPRQMKFLELYLDGALMKDAAAGAGYRGSTPQALCNTGRAILNKFSHINLKALRANALKRRKIAHLLGMYDNSESEHEQSKGLLLMSKYLGG